MSSLSDRYDKLSRQLTSAEENLREVKAERDRLRAVCKNLWDNRDAKADDQAACRRLYNAWLDLRDVVNALPKP